MAKHYPLSPSAMSRIFACPGSIKLEAQLPDQSSDDADRGTRLHDCAERMLRSMLDQEGDHVLPDDPDDRAAVLFSVGMVAELIQDTQPYIIALEQTLESVIIPDHGGTVDVLLRYKSRHGDVLHVLDYKFGKGIAVDAKDNPQLLAYLALAQEHTGPADYYMATIIQPDKPRGEPITDAVYSQDDLSLFREQILAATQKDHLQPGEHCRFCKANRANTCPAVKDLVDEVALAAFREEPIVDLTWSAKVVKALPAIKVFLDSLPDNVLAEIRKGAEVPGVKVVRGPSRKAWSLQDEDVIKRLSKRGIGKRVCTVPKLLTPTQLLKLPGTEKAQDLIEQKPGKLTVVADTDRRKAVPISDLQEFGDLENE